VMNPGRGRGEAPDFAADLIKPDQFALDRNESAIYH